MNGESFLTGLSPALVLVVLFVTLVIEGTGMPWVPYEPIFVVVGQLVEAHRLSSAAALVIGSAGNLLGNLLGYWVGRRAGRALAERYGHRIHLGPKEMRAMEAWFGRYGAATALVGRFFGVIRTPAILGAGLAGMKLHFYLIYSAIGSVIWTAVWTYGALGLVRLIPPGWHAMATWAALLAGFTVFLVPPLAGRLLHHRQRCHGERAPRDHRGRFQRHER